MDDETRKKINKIKDTIQAIKDIMAEHKEKYGQISGWEESVVEEITVILEDVMSHIYIPSEELYEYISSSERQKEKFKKSNERMIRFFDESIERHKKTLKERLKNEEDDTDPNNI